MAMGDGTRKLPARADIRKALRTEAGDSVAVALEERVDKRSRDGDTASKSEAGPDLNEVVTGT